MEAADFHVPSGYVKTWLEVFEARDLGPCWCHLAIPQTLSKIMPLTSKNGAKLTLEGYCLQVLCCFWGIASTTWKWLQIVNPPKKSNNHLYSWISYIWAAEPCLFGKTGCLQSPTGCWFTRHWLCPNILCEKAYVYTLLGTNI